MNRKTIIILLIAAVFVSGCTESVMEFIKGLPGMPSGGETVILGGGGGLKMEIMAPADDETVNSEYPLEPTINVVNEGGSDSEGTICIFGLDERVFPGFSGCECEDYEVVVSDEDSESYKEAIVEFPSYTMTGEEAAGKVSMTASNRYKYTTRGFFEACIKKDQYSKKGCQVKSGSRSVNLLKRTTSGPVSVTKVTEVIKSEENSAELVFTIEVEKKARGSVLNLEDYSSHSCEIGERKQEFEVSLLNVPDEGDVYCGVGTLDEKGGGSVSCKADVTLFDKAGNYLYEGYSPEIGVEVSYSFEDIKTSMFTVSKSI